MDAACASDACACGPMSQAGGKTQEASVRGNQAPALIKPGLVPKAKLRLAKFSRDVKKAVRKVLKKLDLDEKSSS